MAEVLGALAAASQLAATCVKFLELAKRIKRSSVAMKDYERQLQELQSLSQAISGNELLQTPEVGALTYSLLTIIKENSLQPLLERGRFYRSIHFLVREKELFELFQAIERLKTSLSLAINHLQAQAIFHIQTAIYTMPHAVRSGRVTKVSTANPVAQRQESIRSLPAPALLRSTSIFPLESDAMDSNSLFLVDRNTGQHMQAIDLQARQMMAHVPRIRGEDILRYRDALKLLREDNPNISLSMENTNTGSGWQVNGTLLQQDHSALPLNEALANPDRIFIGNSNQGSGRQDNCPVLDIAGTAAIQLLEPSATNDARFKLSNTFRCENTGTGIQNNCLRINVMRRKDGQADGDQKK